MRMLSMIAIATFALSSAAQAGEQANPPPACEPNFYTVDVTVTTPNEATWNIYRNIIDPAVGGKCYSELSSPTQGHTYCMYPLAVGAPPRTPELAEIFTAIAVLTPREGNKAGTLAVAGITTKITCKPKPGEGCITKTCTGGTMEILNCRACS